MATSDKTNINLHLLEPRATEKSYLEQTNRIYVFPVKKSASKQDIAKMVEKEFNVTVTDVRTLIRNGKKTKFSRGKHAYPGTTHRQDKKFAYVRLKKGDSIKVFDEPEDNKTSAKDVSKSKEAVTSRSVSAKNRKIFGRADADVSGSRSETDKNAGKENK